MTHIDAFEDSAIMSAELLRVGLISAITFRTTFHEILSLAGSLLKLGACRSDLIW